MHRKPSLATIIASIVLFFSLAGTGLATPAAAAISLTRTARLAARFAADTKHYSTFKETRPICAWIAPPKPPRYVIVQLAQPGTPALALCKLTITERFQLVNANTGHVAGYSSPTQYPLFVSLSGSDPAVYSGGPIN